MSSQQPKNTESLETPEKRIRDKFRAKLIQPPTTTASENIDILNCDTILIATSLNATFSGSVLSIGSEKININTIIRGLSVLLLCRAQHQRMHVNQTRTTKRDLEINKSCYMER